MRTRVLRPPQLLERDGQIEVRLGELRIDPQRLAIARFRFGEAPQIVQQVAEVEVRFEAVAVGERGFEIERLRVRKMILRLVQVGEINHRRHELRRQQQRPTIRRHRGSAS
jgi:hypothetical protein